MVTIYNFDKLQQNSNFDDWNCCAPFAPSSMSSSYSMNFKESRKPQKSTAQMKKDILNLKFFLGFRGDSLTFHHHHFKVTFPAGGNWSSKKTKVKGDTVWKNQVGCRNNSTPMGVENVEIIPVKTIYFRPFFWGGINPSETHLLVKPIEMMEVKAICLGVLTPLISIMRELSTIDSMENHTSWAPGHVGSDGTSATTSSSSICSHCSIMMAPQFGRFYYHRTHVGRQRKKNQTLVSTEHVA